MSSFTSILVANRGEIAVRVMKTAKSLGYRTIAVYSEADADAPHVRFADEAALIGPPPVGESYLDKDRILKAAKETGAEAVHPGYGFLSENEDFAATCEHGGLTFIGPTPDAIRLMGNKAAAKRRMIDAGVPCVPGYEGEDQSNETLISAANDIGFPIMVKAAAGGGGRGMRLVDNAADLPQALERARSEAERSFGSDEIILEKAIIRPRHVEIQVFADTHGNVIHLGERDCSVQRRHQKVIEEAPCPVMTEELRERMGSAAVEAAKAIDYRGAGTVEFLLDESGSFYFLEMNTRLQVEHPVTELITGHDLVALQIRVAEGAELGLSQEDVRLNGHAMEVRLYAEDPAKGFLPCTGRIDLWSPAEQDHLRFDAGIASGQDVSSFYDPMLAKVISWGETRDIARKRLISGLANTSLFGVTTNQRFLIDALSAEKFAKGEATTAFLVEDFDVDQAQIPAPSDLIAAALLLYESCYTGAMAESVMVSEELRNWSSTGALASRYVFKVGEETFDVTVRPSSASHYSVVIGDASHGAEVKAIEGHTAKLTIDGVTGSYTFLTRGNERIQLGTQGRTFDLTNEVAVSKSQKAKGGGGLVVAPMHGAVTEVFVKEGDRVSKGMRLAILEAMKMQHEILSEVDGVVAAVPATPGAQVAADDMLVEVKVEDDAA